MQAFAGVQLIRACAKRVRQCGHILPSKATLKRGHRLRVHRHQSRPVLLQSQKMVSGKSHPPKRNSQSSQLLAFRFSTLRKRRCPQQNSGKSLTLIRVGLRTGRKQRRGHPQQPRKLLSLVLLAGRGNESFPLQNTYNPSLQRDAANRRAPELVRYASCSKSPAGSGADHRRSQTSIA